MDAKRRKEPGCRRVTREAVERINTYHGQESGRKPGREQRMLVDLERPPRRLAVDGSASLVLEETPKASTEGVSEATVRL